jgi:hypothetical protein
MNRLSLLLFNVGLNHLVGEIPRADRQIPPRPKVTTPILSPQVRKLLKQDPRTDAFQPRYNPTDIHMGPISHQHVNVIAGHLPPKDRDLMFHRDLPNQVAHTKRHLPRQHCLPVFRDPYQMYLQIVLRVRAQLVPFHAITLHDPILRLQGEGFPPSPRETLKELRDSSSPAAPPFDFAQGG